LQGDKLKKQRELKLTTYRNGRIIMQDAYNAIGQTEKAARIRACGTYLKIDECSDGSEHLHTASSCHVRLCQICSKRWAWKALEQLSKVVGYMEQDHQYRWIFITLSFRNCGGADLVQDVDHHMDAIHRFEKYLAYKRAFIGSFRKLEIRHDFKRLRSGYNTHFHILAAVEPDYFTGPDYLSQGKLVEMWQKAGKVDYTPHVWVEAVKLQGEQIQNDKALLEVSKYVTKSSDYIAPEKMRNWEALTKEAVFYIDAALANRRLIGRMGEIRRVHKLLNLSDDPMSEIDSDGEIDLAVVTLSHVFKWDFDAKDYLEF